MKFENVRFESYIMGMICTYIVPVQYPFYQDGFGSFDVCGLNYLMYSIHKKHAVDRLYKMAFLADLDILIHSL